MEDVKKDRKGGKEKERIGKRKRIANAVNKLGERREEREGGGEETK